MEDGRISIWKRLGMELPTVQQRKRLRVSEVNPHLICVLCGGYYIDATTITECLHTFCKTCIVGYLEASKHCPVCDNLVHKTKPHLRLRPDHTLQDLVYKLVPGLFQDEMSKRREFYREEIQAGKLGDAGLPEERERMIYSQDEQISLVLELSSNGKPPSTPVGKPAKHHRLEAADRRYLQCPANITVGHLKKFLKMKFNLCDRFQIDFFHTDEILHDHYTLVDIAYIYSWRRKGPLSLYYTVFTNPAKRFKPDQDVDEDIVVLEAELSIKDVDISKVSERTETSGYFTDDDKDMDINLSDRSLESNILPESGSSDSFELDSSDHESVKPTEDRALDKANTPVLNKLNVDALDKTTEEVLHKTPATVDKMPLNNVDKSADTGVDKVEESASTKVCDSKIVTESEKDKLAKIPQKDMEVSENSKPTENKDVNLKKEVSIEPSEPKDSIHNCDVDVKQTNQKNASDISAEEVVKEHKTVTVDSITSDAKRHEATHEPKVTIEQKTRTSEASTSTGCMTDTYMPTVTPRKDNKPSAKDDDVSEPVVSSTQNTQACQTEPPDSHHEKYDLPHSSDYDKLTSGKTNHKSKVDVSCETDNFVALRQMSVGSVSVSTETEMDDACSTDIKRKKSVDCATDVFDFPQSVTRDNKRTVDCFTDPQDFPESVTDSKRTPLTVDCSTEIDIQSTINNKRKALSVDCSTDMDDSDIVQIKRKSLESLDQRSDNIKSETRGTKRSNSYSSHSPKPSYMAQPLSPTKITLKFSATRSPSDRSSSESVKPAQISKTQSQVTGFQSQYQSFVMELPDKTYDFDSEPEKRVQAPHHGKSTDNYKQTYMNAISTSTKKAQSKTGRPRGRPPKIKTPNQVSAHKEKKHKSRSHSPKHKKHADKHEKHSTSSDAQDTVAQPASSSSSSSNAYTWINKMNSNNKQHAEKKHHKSKSIERSISAPGGELKRVSETTHRSDLKRSSEAPGGELKIPKQFLYFSNGQYTLTTASSLATLKQSSPLSPTTTVWETQTSSYGDKHSKKEKIKDKERKTEKNEKSNTAKRESASSSSKSVDLVNVPTSANTDNDDKQNANVETKPDSKRSPERKPALSTSCPSSETVTTSNAQAIDSSKETISSSSEKFPEYRHQSPFFASYTRFGGQRPSTHLNIPNFTSHFNSAHSLYNHGRYTSDRLGIPIYRSMSHSEPKSVNVPATISKTQDKQRLESLNSHCGFLTPYPSPYLSLSHLHSQIASSLPPSMLSKGYSLDPLKSQISVPSSTSNSPQSKNAIKGGTVRKVKEKSIDNIISAITEMRTKKETTANEQLNGIDLSTKGSRQNTKSVATNNNDKLDRYAFPDDDDDNRTSPKKSSV